MSFIMCEDLVKEYGDFTAVRGISFDVRQGEILGLLGPAGAGKSTTIEMVIGLSRPDYGSVRISGLDIFDNLRRVKSHIGYVPQDIALYDWLSARDNMNLFGRLYGLHGRYLNSRVNELLKIVGLADWADKKVKTFSMGMKRMLNIAASLIHSPSILCLDEPIVGVDPESRKDIFHHIRELASVGTAVLYTTQSNDDLEMLCDRVAIIDKGQIMVLDTCENVLRTAEHETIKESTSGSNPDDFSYSREALPRVIYR
ncbi:MAG: ABC transporter ATP-binding protein [Acidobacteriota bacterium]